MEEEDEIVGQANEDEDELDDDRDGQDSLSETVQSAGREVKQEEPEVPLFRYRNSVTSASYVVKVGNERQGSTRFKPKSAAVQKRQAFFPPAPKRSKSELPASKRESPRSVTPIPQPSRGNTPGVLARAGFRTPMPRSREATPATPRESFVCPICSRELETDNSGMNAHVDFCLSRDAIREATSASSPEKKDASAKRKRDGLG